MSAVQPASCHCHPTGAAGWSIYSVSQPYSVSVDPADPTNQTTHALASSMYTYICYPGPTRGDGRSVDGPRWSCGASPTRRRRVVELRSRRGAFSCHRQTVPVDAAAGDTHARSCTFVTSSAIKHLQMYIWVHAMHMYRCRQTANRRELSIAVQLNPRGRGSTFVPGGPGYCRVDLICHGAVCGAPGHSEFGICPRRLARRVPPPPLCTPLRAKLYYRNAYSNCTFIPSFINLMHHILSLQSSSRIYQSPSESLLLVKATPVESKISEANRTSRRNVATRRHLQASQRLFSLRP